MDDRLFARACAVARGLAIDAVAECHSGHLGLPLGCAEIGAVLYGEILRQDPADPTWANRDRFVLSAGHGSMFLYAWLHLAGYGVSRDDLRRFRALGSITPGHPEYGMTPGVECTTGPLGQGVGNAVGMAVAAKMAAARGGAAALTLVDHRVFCLAGDGCMQEGVAMEAAAFAGHQGLDNLVLIYDANEVTLDAPASATQSEDTAARFAALGWTVRRVDGHDRAEVGSALRAAREAGDGRPQLIVARTVIGKGIPEVAGTAKAHGEGGMKFAEAARRGLGLPEERFFVDPEVAAWFAERKQWLAGRRAAWQARWEAWAVAEPGRAVEVGEGAVEATEAEVLARIPPFAAGTKVATRKAGADVLQPVAAALPRVISGSADLHGSTLNVIGGSGDFTRADRAARNIRFGIREHAMGAILNGVACDGRFRASGATFLVFADYLRPAIRLAALSHLPVTYIFTHDSVGVGEDGPTHQPVETTSALRLIPNLDVIRPADPEETAAAFAAAFTRGDGPTALILTRQVVPLLEEVPLEARREGTLRGGYVARREEGVLEAVLLAAGSEVAVALAAARELGPGVRVVSMPSFHRFDHQPAAYRDGVLPPSCRRRVAVEAGVTGLWARYVGLDGKVVGIDRFGLSAPGGTVLAELGVTVAAVVAAARGLPR